MKSYNSTRRKLLKATGAIAGGSIFGVSSSVPVSAGPVGGESYPKWAYQDYSCPEPTATADSIESSASTKLNYLDSVYAAGEWRFYFRTQTQVGSAYVTNGETGGKCLLDSYHSLEVKNTQGASTDSRHGSHARHFGVSGVQGTLPEWADTAYAVGSALIGYWNPYAGAIFTAAGIIGTLRHPDEDGVNANGIYYDWNAYGEDNITHMLKWESSYPPEAGVEHAVRLTEKVATIPDGYYSGDTSPYNVSWDIYLGSMLEPSSMSYSEQRKYGIEKMQKSEVSALGISDTNISSEPLFRAKKPPVNIVLNTSSTANELKAQKEK